MVGSAIKDLTLQLAGPLLALAFHLIGLWLRKKDESLTEHLKLENYQLRMQLAAIEGERMTPPPTSKQTEGTSG